MVKWLRRVALLGMLFVFFCAVHPAPARADGTALIFRGVARTVFSVFEIPKSILQDSTRVIFPLGIVTGAITGSVRTVVGTLGGALDIARGAAPYAKYALFFI